MSTTKKIFKATLLLAPLALLSGCCRHCAEAGLMFSTPILSHLEAMFLLFF